MEYVRGISVGRPVQGFSQKAARYRKSVFLSASGDFFSERPA